jgi:membrane protein required for colicin V production
MNAADYAIIAILAISLVFGMVRGFMREALALIGWLGGLWLAWRYADAVKPYLGGLLADEPQRTWVARALLLGLVVLVAWVVSEFISYFVHQSGLSVTLDRVLGAVFGLLRGAVLVALLTMAATTVRLDEVRWWKKSVLLPYTVDVSGWIKQFAETALDAEARTVETR